MRLTTYSGTTINTGIDAIFDGLVKIVDAAGEIGSALGVPWVRETQED